MCILQQLCVYTITPRIRLEDMVLERAINIFLSLEKLVALKVTSRYQIALAFNVR